MDNILKVEKILRDISAKNVAPGEKPDNESENESGQ